MYKIATLNKISPNGLRCLTDDYTIIENTEEANGIMVRSQAMHDMEFSPDLLAIARAGAGVNNIPLKRCADEGIVVFNTPGANANSVKELVIAGMLISARNLSPALAWARELTDNVSKTVEKGKGQFAGNEIKGKTLGVIGLGAVGVMVANAAQKLGMDVVGYDPFITLKAAHELSNKIPVIPELADMLPQCDYITIHVPVMDETKGMIDSRRFGQMKDGAVLLNFARDKLVNDEALIDAISSGKLRQYITDFPNDAVIDQEGIICIPHLGASTEEAEDNCATMAATQMMDYLENGNIVNSVNFPACSLGALNKDANARVCILNKNIPSMLGQITGVLADMNINIRNLTNKSRDEYACTLMDVDSDVDEAQLKEHLNFEGIISVRVIK